MAGRTPLLTLALVATLLGGCITYPGDAFTGPTLAVFGSSGPVVAVGAPVTFDGSLSRGEGLTFAWDLGDGTTATGPSAEHRYEEEGNFTVRLTVTAADGTQDTEQQTVQASEGYLQEVWFNWEPRQLDVLILGVADPTVGAAIQEAITAWERGIAELAPELAAELEFRVYWPVTGLVPPLDFTPEIYFVPAGFMASYPFPQDGTCTAFAPAGYLGPDPADLHELYFTAAHEFGHCLGLSHVFHEGEEYEPAFDLLGGGSVHDEWGKSCPSNLNAAVLRMVFGGETGQVLMAPQHYRQAGAC